MRKIKASLSLVFFYDNSLYHFIYFFNDITTVTYILYGNYYNVHRRVPTQFFI